MALFLLNLAYLTALLLCTSRLALRIASRARRTRSVPRKRSTVLLTGSDPAVLATARALKSEGHIVLIADTERLPYLNALRYSLAVSRFIRLPAPVPPAKGRKGLFARLPFRDPKPSPPLSALLPKLITAHNISLWIPFSLPGPRTSHEATSSAVRTSTFCSIISPSPAISTLSKPRPFAAFVSSLETGIRVPKPETVNSRAEIHSRLWAAKHAPFVLTRQPRRRDSGMASPLRAALPALTTSNPGPAGAEREAETKTLTLPPAGSAAPVDACYAAVAVLPISPAQPWAMARVLSGVPAVASALISRGRVAVFSASTSATPLTYIPGQAEPAPVLADMTPVAADSKVSAALLSFVRAWAAGLNRLEGGEGAFHASFKFLVEEGEGERVWPLGVSFDPAPALALQAAADPKAARVLGAAYAAAAAGALDGETLLLPRAGKARRAYSLPPSVLNLVVRPWVRMWLLQESPMGVLRGWKRMAERVLGGEWREEMWSARDPGPWVWRWGVQTPVEWSLGGVGWAFGRR
ncbi:hypothetical protein EJ06DRAFT_552796 [Trichodelitschia bisporula]|uniref:DUF1776-domain-containing protein n=1 Tax=Trichodelitschia bisporula TaxID=703511 RepID=A0A6G1IB28_9PEZI|nr:hypothetical protein EJ06DRAFT_552796 [Trichodelitschia bisporula]